MKKLLIAIAFLAGCASTPQDTILTEPFHFKALQPPAAAALCIIRQAESKVGAFSGREEEAPAPNARKIVIRHNSAGASIVAHLFPAGTGSDVTLWLSNQHLFLRETLVKMLVSGC